MVNTFTEMAVQKKSNNYCCVYGCKTFYSADESISFHQLPNSNDPKILVKNKFGIEELVDRRKIWAIKLKLSKEALTKKHIQVCSKHFTQSDYFSQGSKGLRSRLKSTAVPSLNLPKSSVILSSPKKRTSPKKRASTSKINDEVQLCECHNENLDVNSSVSVQ